MDEWKEIWEDGQSPENPYGHKITVSKVAIRNAMENIDQEPIFNMEEFIREEGARINESQSVEAQAKYYCPPD